MVDTLSKAPKWAIIIGAAVLLALMGYGLYWVAFGADKPEEVAEETILLDMPDPVEDSYNVSALEEFGRAARNRSGNSTEDYWNSLGKDEGGQAEEDRLSISDDLDPNEYSDYERLQIKNGIKTRAQIDAEHERARAQNEEIRETYRAAAGGSGAVRPLTQEQQDSIYLARLEAAYKMAAKYQAQPVAETSAAEPADTSSADSADDEEEERKLDLETEPSSLPTDSFDEDGIISSLDSPSPGDVVHYGSGVRIKPVKATFLKNEKLASGNRVIMRLMQDMTLSDGSVIPANTHITGTCSIGRRMKINVTMLHYGGRMFPVDISVYDNDGTEGIYCPLVEEAGSGKRKAKKVAEGVVSSAGTIAGTLLTGNPILGSMASSGIRTATSSVGSDGTVSVNVSAGYEFYVYENVKD